MHGLLDGPLLSQANAGLLGSTSIHGVLSDILSIKVNLQETRLNGGGMAVATNSVFTQTALALLSALTWPGNLAELRGAIERVVRQTGDDVIQIEHMLPALQLDRAPTPFVPAGNLREARLKFERDYIAAVLQHCGWRMAEAAQTLGIQRPNLYRKARQLGIPVTRMPEQLS